jgi:hypothetical protein
MIPFGYQVELQYMALGKRQASPLELDDPLNGPYSQTTDESLYLDA